MKFSSLLVPSLLAFIVSTTPLSPSNDLASPAELFKKDPQAASCNKACSSASQCSGTCFICLNGVCRPRTKRSPEELFKKDPQAASCNKACSSASQCSGTCFICLNGVCRPRT